MYELEKNLKSNSELLKAINFHADEANVDAELKGFLKKFIKEKFNRLPDDKKEYQLSIVSKKSKESQKQTHPYSDFFNLYVKKVYLPSELTDELKEIVRKEKKLFVNPDLLLEIREEGTESVAFIPIELKSTKKDSIRGSSIQQVTPSEWVLFVKHTDSTVNITAGQYVNSITEAVHFPDRSPRPDVSFKTLIDHNEKNRLEEEKELIYSNDVNSLEERHKLLGDWQGLLVERWLEVINRDNIRKNEAWFNNSIRRYTIDFLTMYEQLSDTEKTDLKKKIKDTISLYKKSDIQDIE